MGGIILSLQVQMLLDIFLCFFLFTSVHLLQPLRSAQYYNVIIANNLKTRCGYEFRMEFS